MYRPKTGIPRAKQLKEFKQEEDLKAATKFTKKIQENTIRRQQDNTF